MKKPDRIFRAGAMLLAIAVLIGPTAAETPLAVGIARATAMPDVQSQSLTGEIAARDTLNAAFPSGGRIAEVLVEEGDRVRAGAPLARMESVQQEQALRAAEAGLSTAEADYRQAVEDLDRQDQLLARGATTRISRDSAEDARTIAEGTLDQARAELDRARKSLDDTTLLAPEAATVTDRAIEPGQVVGAAQPVIELALGTDVDAVFDVPEAMLTNDDAQPGRITLSLIDQPTTTFTGTPREISPLIDASTGTVQVKVSVSDPPPDVSYGDAVRGTVTFEGAPRITLPYTALTATAEGPAVWSVDPETMQVATTLVRIARFETGRIVLAEGLEEGALVVTDGAHLLYPGRIVRDVEGPK
ncbi:efflux RND transporter periplasmic adaptor subunit [Arenibacterium halophilum]|uniref:Efflux RND transporter periplasmic adaptor subunit n=1 Tax=Arenibacterium halophilum TaxID=2583821 RepID=A0ABY2XF83_9RHOB|nr:efflux RND transporter periplasmic adaptor subunit [Arenibacterium halophilum]TMV15376.1 efflux RND transporter periplasmic adaptor subunit [Arenibacterium halophilum]